MEIKINNNGEYIPATLEVVDGVMVVSPKEEKVDVSQFKDGDDSAQIDSAGESSVICCAGNNSIVKAKIGSWITLSEWVYSYEKNRNIPKCVKTVYVDGDIIKADTWYKLVDGEFKEVKP